MPSKDDETGQRLRANWLLALSEIAAIGLQRRNWLDPKQSNPHWSYLEFVESYPTVEQLSDAAARGWLSRLEADVLQRFSQTLLSYEAPGADAYDHQAILDDPAWHEVTRLAKAALDELGHR
jgi:hypothetical protein